LQDSLAAEIEGTMRKELSLDDPECEEQKYARSRKKEKERKQNINSSSCVRFSARFSVRFHRRRVFETVKNINQTVRQRSLTPTGANIPGSNQSLSARTSPQSSGLCTPHSGVALDNRTQSILMETAANQERRGAMNRSGRGGGHVFRPTHASRGPSPSEFIT